jgi:uncharacterized protein with PIN domain
MVRRLPLEVTPSFEAFFTAIQLHELPAEEFTSMVVVGIFNSEVEEEQAIRLVGEDTDGIYLEKIAENETLVSMRARNLPQAQRLRRLMSRAGAQEVKIDAEAA